MGRPDLRRRIVLVALITLAVSNLVVAGSLIRNYSVRGYADFSICYVAGHILDFGDPHRLYDIPYQAAIHEQLLPGTSNGEMPLLYNHAPHEALLYMPLARLRFDLAFYVWSIISLAALAASIVLLARITGLHMAFVALITAAFFPVAVTLAQGQISALVLLLYVIALRALLQGRANIAALSLAVALCKPQLILPFVAILVLRRQWRFAAWFLAGVVAILVISVAIVGREGLAGYVEMLRFFDAHPTIGSVFPANMENLRGAVVGLLSWTHPSEAIVRALTLIFSSATVVCVSIANRKTVAPNLLLWLGAAVCATALVSYHMYLHDASLLLIPIVVAVAEMKRESSWRPLWLLVALIILFATPLYMFAWRHHIAYLFVLPIAMLGYFLLQRSASVVPPSHLNPSNAAA